MGAGAIFVLFVVVVVLVVIALAFFGFGASQWKRQTDAPEPVDAEGDELRPKHKVLDEKGNLVATDYGDGPRPRESDAP